MIPDRSETDSEGKTRYFYSAATIRKWLLEEPSEDMQYAYHNGPMSPRFQWRERYMNMIAAKLQELEGVE